MQKGGEGSREQIGKYNRDGLDQVQTGDGRRLFPVCIFYLFFCYLLFCFSLTPSSTVFSPLSAPRR